MTTRPVRPLPDRVQVLEIAQERHRREMARLAEDSRRTSGQAEGAIEDVRDLQGVVRVLRADGEKTRSMVLAIGGQQGEILSVMRDMAAEMAAQRAAFETLSSQQATTRAAATEARSKASGAHKLALEHEARLSKAEDAAREWEAKISVAQQEGSEVALARAAKVRLTQTLTSVPVVLAIIAAVGGAGVGAALGIGLGVGVVLAIVALVARRVRKGRK